MGEDPWELELWCSFVYEPCLFKWTKSPWGQSLYILPFSSLQSEGWPCDRESVKTHCHGFIETLCLLSVFPRWVKWLNREEGMRLSWIPEAYAFEMAHEFLWSPYICDVGNVSLGANSYDGSFFNLIGLRDAQRASKTLFQGVFDSRTD